MEYTLSPNDIDEKLIVFESNPDFSDNSRGFWEFIVSNTDYKTFWVINNEETYRLMSAEGIPCGLKDSAVSNEMIAKAKILISSTFEFAYRKRIGQIHIAAWHGFPLKLIGFFNTATSDESNFDNLRVITTQTDLIPVTSRFGQVVISGMFATDPRKACVTGYPRNDLVFWSDGKNILEEIIEKRFLNSILILYMPTMHKGLKDEGDSFEKNIFNYSDYDIAKLNNKLTKFNAYLLVKTHFEDDGKIKKSICSEFDRIIFLDNTLFTKNLITVYHILNAFDLLITDYSSIFVDFLLLNRPIVFSCPDIEKYKLDRGFIADNPEYLMPGNIVKSQTELLNVLEDVFMNGNDSYLEHRSQLKNIYHRYTDGHSSRRLFKRITKLISEDNLQDISKREIFNMFNDMGFCLSQYGYKRYIAEFYYGDENGFCETQKFRKEYIIRPYELNHQKMVFKCISNTIYIRFDPSIVGDILIKNFKLQINNEQSENYIVRNGTKCGDYLFFYDNDPQIEHKIEIMDVQGDLVIIIEFDCCSLFSLPNYIIKDFGVELNNVKEKESSLREELENIKKSKMWKLLHLICTKR